jgi:hypothetical protein
MPTAVPSLAALPQIAIGRGEARPLNGSLGHRILTSCGAPPGGTETAFVSPDTRERLPETRVGEISVRSVGAVSTSERRARTSTAQRVQNRLKKAEPSNRSAVALRSQPPHGCTRCAYAQTALPIPKTIHSS